MNNAFSPKTTTAFFEAIKNEEHNRRRRVPNERRRRIGVACLNCKTKKIRCEGGNPCKACALNDLQCCLEYIIERLCGTKISQYSTDSLVDLSTSLSKRPDPVLPNEIFSNVTATSPFSIHYDFLHPPAATPDINNLQYNTEPILYPESRQRNDNNTNHYQEEYDNTASNGDSNDQNVDEIMRLIGKIKVENGESRYIGASAGEAFVDSVQSEILADPSFSDLSTYSHSHPVYSPNEHDVSAVNQGLNLLPPSEVADFLIKTFYRHVQANFFFYHETLLRYRLNIIMNYQNPSVDPGFLCLVMMIFALGSQFAHLEVQSASTLLDNPGKQFFDTARLLLPQVILQCKPSLVQVSLLMGLYLQSTLSQKSSYTYFGLALTAAVANGLHRSCENPDIDPKTKELRNRLWWSVYTMDRLISIATGRPLSIADSECDAALPTVVPELEIEGSASNVHNIISMSKIAQIMGKTMEQLYGTVNYKKNPITIIESLRADLNDWKQSLPSFQILENLDPKDPLFRANVHLHMTYDQAIIIMSRPVLLHKMKNAKNSPRVNRINEDCILAARHLISLVHLLQQHSQLSCYSFFDYNYTFSSALVVLLHCVTEPCQEDDIAMEYAYAALDYMAEGNDPAKNCARIIRLFDTHLKGIRSAGNNNSSQSGFMAWQRWIAEVASKNNKANQANFVGNYTPSVSTGRSSASLTPGPTPMPSDMSWFSLPDDNSFSLDANDLDEYIQKVGAAWDANKTTPDLANDSSLLSWANADQGMDIEGSWLGNMHPSWLDYVCP
ncbi:transcription factor [Schizosaccharomyces cryophilus OY26]|uniref:Transcription factor n=1 Tax=Schizosaccharomyces cryophilus (strain OY26 / ATCC MYA-4695 / CBS 11777 / NBRC 106824 / NRRL Y48691) TaxID=653667 RepID=S9W0Z0_SCHCR|nr:transcription factor [Schizosaccharomyces cryophilus OY26]EPY51720.1 transcription factor [Schizosaccharomyces cryophilus OY26]